GTMVYGVGNLVNKFLSFLLVPLFTRFLLPGDYGVMAMLALLNMVLAGVFSLGTINALGICYFGESDSSRRPRIVWTAAAIVFVNSTVWLLLAAMFAPELSQALLRDGSLGRLVIISLFTLAVNSVATPFLAYLRMEERAVAFVCISVAGAVVTMTLSVISVVYLGRGVVGILGSAAIAAVVTLLLALVTVARALSPGWSKRIALSLVRIGYPSIFGMGAFFVIDWADRYFLQRMVGMAEVGVYSVGYTIGMVMAFVAEGTFGSAWPPFFMSFIGRREEATQLFGSILKYCVFGFGTLTALFFLFARPVVTLMTAPAYHEAATVVGMIAAAYSLKACYLVLLPPLYFEKKLHIQTGVEWLAAAINAGLCLLLIPVFRMRGAAGATLLSYVALPVFTFLAARKYMRISYEWKRIAGFLALLAATALASAGFALLPIWGHVTLGLLVTIGILLTTYQMLLTRAERDVLLKYGRLAIDRAWPVPRRVL
ncbi:MAG TPA: oligosaccharide flippase family protein, partial [Gemmatimonadaceae bacterium]|nr:oligosaccharide flippase family protein [Gemmatimonadaceae bacterium]